MATLQTQVKPIERGASENCIAEIVRLFGFDGIPDRMQEWILEIVHGDHDSAEKMREIVERVYWEDKNK